MNKSRPNGDTIKDQDEQLNTMNKSRPNGDTIKDQDEQLKPWTADGTD